MSSDSLAKLTTKAIIAQIQRLFERTMRQDRSVLGRQWGRLRTQLQENSQAAENASFVFQSLDWNQVGSGDAAAWDELVGQVQLLDDSAKSNGRSKRTLAAGSDPNSAKTEGQDSNVSDPGNVQEAAAGPPQGKAEGSQRQRSNPGDDRHAGTWVRFFTRFRRSVETCQWRRSNQPKIKYAGDLPVHANVTRIRQSIVENQVIVLCGETGSGKSTQLPKICLEAGLGITGFIGHTQPRRIAARSVATRLAEEMESKLGEAVGFKIRFYDDTNEKTFVKLMTDGILLAETQGDRFFEKYDAIILDEAHERSLNIDFLIGYLKQVCVRRPEFRLIITSATIDANRFANHFANQDGVPAPIIEVEGRGFPVEIQYRSPAVEDGSWVNQDQSVLRAVEELASLDRGHILVFLPTERDILSLSRKLRNLRFGGEGQESIEVIPLYARLSSADQQQIFKPTSRRRIVLATNVAESSLTVPGIKYVVDTGTARISRYSSRSKVQRLPVEAISQASANQRAGRCGRVGPGVCLRLYSEDDFQLRDEFTTPEIRRTNLASVILQAKMLNLGRLEDFPFIDPPRPEALTEGANSLFEIGAIDLKGDLTELGRQLGKLPIDPRIGRMIVEASGQGCLNEVLVIAAALEVQDPRVRPIEQADAADQAHKLFQDKRSDFMSFLKLWNFYHEERENHGRSALRKSLHAKFISPERMNQWIDVHRQLKQMVRDLRLPFSKPNDNFANIHRSLMAGLLSGIAALDEKEPKLKRYQGAGNVRFQLWPGCGLDRLPKWVMVGEIVETSRNFGRTVASIDVSWIEPLAGHLVKRRYSQPRWNPKACGVTANEQVTLFGLPIVAKRRVPFGRIDPTECRLLMISEGFFLGQWEQAVPDFLQKNWQLQTELQDLSKKGRRLGWMVDEQRVVDFYADRIPEDVVDAATLNRFLKKASKQTTQSLVMTHEDLITEQSDYVPQDFPSTLDVGTARLPLLYDFAPSDPKDGVFVQVPVEALGQINDQRLAWVIPGWVEAKVVQMIRALPKPIRRNLVPAPDTARKVATELTFGEGSFFQQVASRLSVIAGMPIDLEQFAFDKLDPFLTMGIQVVDQQGIVLAQGRKLSEIREQLGHAGVEATSQIKDESWQKTKQTTWTFGTVPEKVTIERGELKVDAFPAIFDEQDSVGMRLFDNPGTAHLTHVKGLQKLFALSNRKSLKSQLRWLPELDKIRLLMSRWISVSELESSLQLLMVRVGMIDPQKVIRTEGDFQRTNAQAATRIASAAVDIAKWLPSLAEAVHRVDNRISEVKTQVRLVKPFNDARGQVRALLAEGFLSDTPWTWLQQYPRFLAGVEYRLSRLAAASIEVDLEKMALVNEYWDRYLKHREKLEIQKQIDPELEQLRWMIEEYRVSLFAQPLGTGIKISPQRLDKQWQQVRSMM